MTEAQIQNGVTNFRKSVTRLYEALEEFRAISKRVTGQGIFDDLKSDQLVGENTGLSPADLQTANVTVQAILAQLPEGADKSILKVII